MNTDKKLQRDGLEYWTQNPEKPGYMKFERTLTYDEFEALMVPALKAEPYEDASLYDYLDYLHMGPHRRDGNAIPRVNRIFISPVKGSSEGHYLHCLGEISNQDHMIRIFLAKTCCEGDTGLDIMCRVLKIIHNIYHA